jgi:hypothetical protein
MLHINIRKQQSSPICFCKAAQACTEPVFRQQFLKEKWIALCFILKIYVLHFYVPAFKSILEFKSFQCEGAYGLINLIIC